MLLNLVSYKQPRMMQTQTLMIKTS